MPTLQLPPLTLYVHLPWCVKRCPYCDFNAHRLNGELPEADYIRALIADLEAELPRVWGRPVHAVFFGGGTPSLFSAAGLEALLGAVSQRFRMAPDAEITLEANPGTVEHDRFAAYRAAGINRISLGVQSFDNGCLQRLGRIHDAGQAERAIGEIHRAGFDNFNLDLMYALPEQSVDMAVADIERALAFGPAHVSHYQLTLEPGTGFAARPPTLPDDDTAWAMQDEGTVRLHAAGLARYETSAWARPGRQCRHNLNYWRYGDYLGIGAGAHGKLTLPAEDVIVRTMRHRHPRQYLAAAEPGSFTAVEQRIEPPERVFEYFLNRLRLDRPIDLDEFEGRTGLAREVADAALREAVDRDLLVWRDGRLCRTGLGERFLNDLQAVFLPPGDARPVSLPASGPTSAGGSA